MKLCFLRCFTKCDVIKQNESELTNIDFKIQPIIHVVFVSFVFFLVLSTAKMAVSLEL